mmetsp:Transcript_85726/g.239663  ORF Transcript_85726/g.239663 Transcript_85726/m.239663 type:complete len:122 (-) Transcript_85726:158-523(-)
MVLAWAPNRVACGRSEVVERRDAEETVYDGVVTTCIVAEGVGDVEYVDLARAHNIVSSTHGAAKDCAGASLVEVIMMLRLAASWKPNSSESDVNTGVYVEPLSPGGCGNASFHDHNTKQPL